MSAAEGLPTKEWAEYGIEVEAHAERLLMAPQREHWHGQLSAGVKDLRVLLQPPYEYRGWQV